MTTSVRIQSPLAPAGPRRPSGATATPPTGAAARNVRATAGALERRADAELTRLTLLRAEIDARRAAANWPCSTWAQLRDEVLALEPGDVSEADARCLNPLVEQLRSAAGHAGIIGCGDWPRWLPPVLSVDTVVDCVDHEVRRRYVQTWHLHVFAETIDLAATTRTRCPAPSTQAERVAPR